MKILLFLLAILEITHAQDKFVLIPNDGNMIIANLNPINLLRAESSLSPIYKPEKTVRLIYLVPKDREEKKEYKDALNHAYKNIQNWYLRELNYRRTFSFFHSNGDLVDVITSRENENWFSNNAGDDIWIILTKATIEAERILGQRPENEIWVIYIDANRKLNQCDYTDSGGLEGGGGYPGLTVMHSDDLLGLIENGKDVVCKSYPEFDNNLWRWVGGGAHELGHSFGLDHPSDLGRICDKVSCVMEDGYTDYPNTYLTDSGKVILKNNSVFSNFPIINSVFNKMEDIYNLKNKKTRKHTSGIYYRYYNKDTYLIVLDNIVYTIIDGIVSERGNLKDLFLNYSKGQL